MSIDTDAIAHELVRWAQTSGVKELNPVIRTARVDAIHYANETWSAAVLEEISPTPPVEEDPEQKLCEVPDCIGYGKQHVPLPPLPLEASEATSDEHEEEPEEKRSGVRFLLWLKGGLLELFPPEGVDPLELFADPQWIAGEWIVGTNAERDPLRVRTSEIVIVKVADPDADDDEDALDGPTTDESAIDPVGSRSYL